MKMCREQKSAKAFRENPIQKLAAHLFNSTTLHMQQKGVGLVWSLAYWTTIHQPRMSFKA